MGNRLEIVFSAFSYKPCPQFTTMLTNEDEGSGNMLKYVIKRPYRGCLAELPISKKLHSTYVFQGFSTAAPPPSLR